MDEYQKKIYKAGGHLFHGPLDNEPLLACYKASAGTTHSEQGNASLQHG